MASHAAECSTGEGAALHWGKQNRRGGTPYAGKQISITLLAFCTLPASSSLHNVSKYKWSEVLQYNRKAKFQNKQRNDLHFWEFSYNLILSIIKLQNAARYAQLFNIVYGLQVSYNLGLFLMPVSEILYSVFF